MLHPVLALIDMPIIIGILVVGAVLFGADKLPKLARSAGQAKKEFMMGQIEADEATAKAREEARQRMETQSTEAPPPAATSDKGTPTA
jgi:sec-independent protein translocase protein TatA